ncbi:hypothetical protein [Rhodopseudomonas sp. B29]|uniref:hypothetical protein n=1 Tax=Rhodopseudomonas sp. B29 TaxID=95607 RepID=UPI00034C81F5|nr:hypothetical protein [Rhodopseudomonas sp. B29]
MNRRISGAFATRREAELAIERLVQEHGIERQAIDVRSRGQANSAGTEVAGADAESGHPGIAKQGDPQLGGAIEVNVQCRAADPCVVEAAMKELGAEQVT